MSLLKNLASQTIWYGLSHIIGRFLVFLMTPLYTFAFGANIAEFGQLSLIYSYSAFLVVLLTFGLETTYFYYSKKTKEDLVFNVVKSLLWAINIGFLVVALLFSQSIANFIGFPNNVEYIILLIFILCADALSALPLARLRNSNQAKKFAYIRLGGVIITVLFNLYFYLYGHYAIKNGWPHFFIANEPDIVYAMIANLMGSLFQWVLLWKHGSILTQFVLNPIWTKRIIKYAYPMVFVGLAGIVNELIDRILLEKMLGNKGEYEVGLYSAFYRFAMIMTVFIQAFRYAAEPFFFERFKHKNAKKTYAVVMNYFIIICSSLLLGTLLFKNQLAELFIRNSAYFEDKRGMQVVPILLFANLFVGMYYNVSVWYKVKKKTKIGAAISISAAIFTIVANIIFIPYFGLIASAYITFFSYLGMLIAGYLIGQKNYRVPYNLKKALFYIGLAIGLNVVGALWSNSNVILFFGLNFSLIASYLFLAYQLEKPLFK